MPQLGRMFSHSQSDGRRLLRIGEERAGRSNDRTKTRARTESVWHDLSLRLHVARTLIFESAPKQCKGEMLLAIITDGT